MRREVNSIMKLTHWIAEYEVLCEKGLSQYMVTKKILRKIKNELYKNGLEYNAKTLALYGSKRALDYTEKGLLEGSKHIEGN